jgi:hypothetical protein
MKISHKAIAIGLIASAFVVATFLISIKIVVDQNSDRLVQEIQRTVGRRVAFDQLRLDLWRGPGLSVKLLRVAEDSRFAATPLIQAKELRFQLGWLALLLGHLEVKRLILDEPEIQIIRNEAGDLNLFALALTKEGPPEAKEKRAQATPRLRISSVRVANAKIYYVDRFLKEPVEIVIRNVDLDVTGLSLTGRAKIKLAANLFESQRQNIRLEGRVGPLPDRTDPAQQPLDLHVRADPLLLQQLTRAIPSLRETADFYLGVTGPVTIKARLLGTIRHPRITDFSLTGAVFGSNKDNASVSGEWDFSHADSWTEGKIKGKITLNSVSLDQVRKLPAVRRALPSSLVSGGLLGVTADVDGRWDDLNVRAVIQAGNSDIQYRDWFRKIKGIPADIELKGKRQKDRLLFEEASLTIHNTKLLFSGTLEAHPERLLILKLRSERADLTGWDRLLPWLSSYSPSGNLRIDLSVKKNFGSRDRSTDIRGNFDLAGVRLKGKNGGRSIEKITASVSFLGREARVDNGSMRLGPSDLSFQATLPDLSRPVVSYALQSPRLNVGYFTGLAENKTDEMSAVFSKGEIQIGREKTSLQGKITSANGVVQELPYRDLHGDISWSPGNLSFRNVTFHALSGILRGAVDWETQAENSQRLALEPHIENVDLKILLAQKFPKFKDHIEGKLNLIAKLSGASKNGLSLQGNLQGQGETQLVNGTIRDFNLIELVLSKITALPGMSDLDSSRISARYSTLMERRDTPFSRLTATFTVGEGRILSKDFHMVTPDYSIYGQGWVGFDKSLRWNATLVMSGPLTRELVQEHKNIRYLLDRQGRLAIPFRLEGTLPRVQAKPDLQKLAEAIQRGFRSRGKGDSSQEEGQGVQSTKKKPTRGSPQKSDP